MKYKRQYLAFLLIAFLSNTRAQVSIGTQNPDASSVLELKSDTKGLLFPRVTTFQRDAINLPSKGLLVYNTYRNAVQLFDVRRKKTTAKIELGTRNLTIIKVR